MRGLVVPAALALTLCAVPVFGQAAAQQPAPKPAQPTAPPAQQPPAAQQPAAQPQPPQPFPEGAKIAFINLPVIAQNSTAGRSASTKIDDLQKKKQSELQEKNKALQAAQQKLSSGGTVLNDAARGQLEKDIERMQREIQFAQQNAQAEVQDLTRDLQEEFRQKLIPVITKIAEERGLHYIFSGGDAGFVYAHPGLDLTQEVIKRLDTGATAK
ncbi:MAG TPA: OmpH family outer membrane protein [Vicinamibacterales bacterium]|nr:OmpH family outer membrane protein [Vicinamibacterales bacterium]